MKDEINTLDCHSGFLRPQNVPLTANFIIFYETILVFTIFEPKWFLEVPKVSIVSFFHFHIIVLNLPVCFKLLYWKLPSRCLTLKNRNWTTLSFTCVTIDAVIYTACCKCYFQFVFAAGVLFPLLWTNSLV